MFSSYFILLIKKLTSKSINSGGLGELFPTVFFVDTFLSAFRSSNVWLQNFLSDFMVIYCAFRSQPPPPIEITFSILDKDAVGGAKPVQIFQSLKSKRQILLQSIHHLPSLQQLYIQLLPASSFFIFLGGHLAPTTIVFCIGNNFPCPPINFKSILLKISFGSFENFVIFRLQNRTLIFCVFLNQCCGYGSV